jgi:hypothetical protein
LQDGGQSFALCAALRGHAAPQKAFRALLATQLTANNEAYSFRYAVAGRGSREGSEDLRVDLLPDEGAYTLGLLTVREGKALMIDSQEKRFADACDPDRLFEKFFGLKGITPDLVKALLVGQVPALTCEDIRTYRQEAGRLQFLDSRTHRVWQVEESSGALLGVEILNDTHSKVYARAQRERGAQGDVITIAIFNPLEASAEMQIRKFTINPALSEGLFNVVPPVGYTQEECP